MHLYKYVSNPNFILNDGYIRATQLSALNDPFEAHYSKKELKKLIKEFNCELDEKKFLKYIEKNKHKVGVISFTEAKDDLLMWAHYANEHKGALIGFSFYTGFFKKLFRFTETAFDKPFDYYDGKCHAIIYRKQPMYKIDMFDRDYSNISVEGKDRLLFEIFLQKSDEWIYEKEHRIILKLSQADKVILDDFDKHKDIKFIDNMLNDDLLEKPKIEFESCKKENGDKSTKLHIFLEDIESEEDRSILGNSLASLAKNNSEILYLFKVDSSSISSLTYGIKSSKEIMNKKYFNTFFKGWDFLVPPNKSIHTHKFFTPNEIRKFSQLN
jgi:hypothetical protein